MLLEVCFLTFTSVFILCTKTERNLCLAGISFCKTPSSFPFWLFRAWNVPANPNCLGWRVLQRLDKGGSLPPWSCEQAPDSKLSRLQGSHLTLPHLWRTQGQTSPNSYTGNSDLPSQTSPLLLKWPSQQKRPSELIVQCDSGWAESSNIGAVCQSKKAKHLTFKGHLPVCIPAPALLPKKKFARSHWHVHSRPFH